MDTSSLKSNYKADISAQAARVHAKFKAVLDGPASGGAPASPPPPRETVDIGNAGRADAQDHGTQMKDFAEMRAKWKAQTPTIDTSAQREKMLKSMNKLIGVPEATTGGF